MEGENAERMLDFDGAIGDVGEVVVGEVAQVCSLLSFKVALDLKVAKRAQLRHCQVAARPARMDYARLLVRLYNLSSGR